MKTRRVLFGWIDFASTEDVSPDWQGAMLAAEGLAAGEVERIGSPAGTLIAGSQGASLAMDPESGAIAAVLGRPRWADPDCAARADTGGHAAAALLAYRRFGDGLLRHMAANFALVIVDPARTSAVLAIDRGGIERLCLARVGSLLVFSTSARAVARHPAVRAKVDGQAMFEYLFCHMVPSPDTAFSGVDKLLPAECLMFRGNQCSRQFYWHLPYQLSSAGDAELHTQFRNLVRQAVSRQYDARPTGAFLSGGTDSSTVTGYVGEVSGQPAQTFSIGFDAEGFDELEFARVTAQHFNTRSHEFYVTPAHVAEAIPLIAATYDEPFGNASAAPTYFCAKLAREQGIQVILAGDGGDEFFGGNERYAKQGVFEHYQSLPPALRRVLEPTLEWLPGQSLMPLRKAQSYVRQARIPLPDRLETYNFLHRGPLGDVFEPEFLATVDPARPMALMRDAYFRCASSDPVERMMHLDHKFTLADNDLRKVTRMCEAAGVEVRFPFLDDDLVTFSSTLRAEHKVRGKRLRVLFKEALRGFLPEATITKAKHGFGLPFGVWLNTHGPLKDLADSTLAALARRGILKPEYLARLRRDHATEHASYFGVMIWVLVQLELWLQANES